MVHLNGRPYARMLTPMDHHHYHHHDTQEHTERRRSGPALAGALAAADAAPFAGNVWSVRSSTSISSRIRISRRISTSTGGHGSGSGLGDRP